MMKRLRDIFIVLTHPSVWAQNYPHSEEWDQELTRLLDEGQHFEYIDAYRMRLGGYTLWVENHPYASFRPSPLQIRARRVTILRAGKVYMNDLLAHLRKPSYVRTGS